MEEIGSCGWREGDVEETGMWSSEHHGKEMGYGSAISPPGSALGCWGWEDGRCGGDGDGSTTGRRQGFAEERDGKKIKKKEK